MAEAATLAGVLPAPSRYNPVSSAENAEVRRGYVLGRMLDLGFIDEPNTTRRWPIRWSHAARRGDRAERAVRRRDGPQRDADALRRGNLYRRLPGCNVARLASAEGGQLRVAKRPARVYPAPRLSRSDAQIELTDDMLRCPRGMASGNSASAGTVRAGRTVARAGDGRLGEQRGDHPVPRRQPAVLPWAGISWAKPFIDRETRPGAETAAEVLPSVTSSMSCRPRMAAGRWRRSPKRRAPWCRLTRSTGRHRADRRFRLYDEQVQPGAPGLPAAGLRVQTLYLLGGAGTRQYAGDRCSGCARRNQFIGTRGRLAPHQLQRPLLRSDAHARSAGSLDEPRFGAPAAV